MSFFKGSILDKRAKTYVIKAGEIYQIGTSPKPQKVLESIKEELDNLEVIIIVIFNYDISKELYNMFDDRREYENWYSLNKVNEEFIIGLSQMSEQSVKKVLNLKG